MRPDQIRTRGVAAAGCPQAVPLLVPRAQQAPEPLVRPRERAVPEVPQEQPVQGAAAAGQPQPLVPVPGEQQPVQGAEEAAVPRHSRSPHPRRA